MGPPKDNFEITAEFVREWNRIRHKVDTASGAGVHNTPTAISINPASQDKAGKQTPTLYTIKIVSTSISSLTGIGRYQGSVMYGPTNNNPTTSIQESDVGMVSSNYVEVWNISEINGGGALHVNDHVLGVQRGYNNTTGMPIYWVTTGGTVQYGKVATAWVAGQKYVELTPVKAYDNTASNGAPNVHALIYSDVTGMGKAPAMLDVSTGDILAYVTISTIGTPYLCLAISPPILTPGSTDYYCLQMSSGLAVWGPVRAI